MSGICLKVTRRGAGSGRGAGETRGLLADRRGAGCGWSWLHPSRPLCVCWKLAITKGIKMTYTVSARTQVTQSLVRV